MKATAPCPGAIPVDLLLVEPSGIERIFTMEALRELRVAHRVHCVGDGEEAIDFLRRRGRHAEAPRPDLVLLALDLPRERGLKVLAEMKSDDALKSIPVVMLGDSGAEEDVAAAYAAHANGFITKPMDRARFGRVARALEEFWFEVAVLPSRRSAARPEAGREAGASGAEGDWFPARGTERQQQARLMEAVGVLAGGVAHDFNNLLTIVRGNAEMIAAGRLDGAAAVVAARQIVTAADRGATLARQLLIFARREWLRVRPVELNAMLGDLCAMLRRVLGPSIVLETRLCDSPLPLLADPAMIEQAMTNLALNARDAMPRGGRLTLETRRVELTRESVAPSPPAGAGSYALIRVADTGVGIAPDVLPHVFEPFFTTKETGKGTGLGLAAVYGVVRQHRGEVEARSEPGRGAEFCVWLPLDERAAPVAAIVAADPMPEARDGAGETILLVDDEDMVREMAATVLRLHGYEVIEAASAAEALARWEAIAEEVDLLLTDLVMPGMSGDQLARILRREKPALRIVYFSGRAGDAAATPASGEQDVFLAKPFTLETLTGAVWRALRSNPGPEISGDPALLPEALPER